MIFKLVYFVFILCFCTQLSLSQKIARAPMNATDRSVFGIDISHYNPVKNWTRFAETKMIKFAFTKATEGKSYLDSTFDQYWAELNKAGIATGAYHFYRLDHTVHENFANVKKHLLDRVKFSKEHLFAVDFESNYSHRKPVDVAKDLYSFLQMVEHELGFKPWIYTYALFWKEHIAEQHKNYPFHQYPLWIAHYGPDNPNIPIDTWPDYHIWQFTSSGHVDGIEGRVDCSVWKNPPENLFKAREITN